MGKGTKGASRTVWDRVSRSSLPPSGVLWVRSGLVASSLAGLATSNVYPQWDMKCVRIYENQRWNPVTGYTARWGILVPYLALSVDCGACGEVM